METQESNNRVRDAKTSALNKLSMQKVDGVNYLKFSFNFDLVEMFNKVKAVSIRTDDILSIGFPRSGNHWTFEIIFMILTQTTDFHKDQFYSRLLEFLGLDVCATVGKISSPRILTTHNRIQYIPEEAVSRRIKLVYVLRNPKDVIVSLYKFSCSLAHEASTFHGSWDEYFELQMRGECPWGYWFDHVLGMESFLNEHPECPVYVLVYEKIKENPVEEIQKLCTFLEKPTSMCEEIAEVTEFFKMRDILGKTKMAVQSENHFRNGPNDILRKGVIGDWKNVFTVCQSESFNRLFDEKMKHSKLGDLVRKYII